MLTIQFIRDHRESILDRLKIKNFKQPELIDQIISSDDSRRSLQVKTNELQAEMNQLSKEIGMLFKQGETEKANGVKEQTTGIKKNLESLEKELQEATKTMNELLVQVPNIPHPSVPPGKAKLTIPSSVKAAFYLSCTKKRSRTGTWVQNTSSLILILG